MQQSKVLYLTLKKQWFDMILSGVKKEEYREFKPYWSGRFTTLPAHWCKDHYLVKRAIESDISGAELKQFDLIRFTNGYAKNSPAFDIDCKGINIGIGNTDWGAPAEDVFIISLGAILKTYNIHATT